MSGEAGERNATKTFNIKLPIPPFCRSYRLLYFNKHIGLYPNILASKPWAFFKLSNLIGLLSQGTIISV